MFNKLNFKYRLLLVIAIMLMSGILWFFIFEQGQQKEQKASNFGGVFQKVSEEQINSVNMLDWKEFFYEDYGYNFQVPRGWLIARTHSVLAGDESKLLGKDAKKQTLAFSRSGECYLYFYPEGGYARVDLRTKSLPEQYRDMELKGRLAVLETYDEENYTIRFNNYHDFRIQIFVSKNFPDCWSLVEKMLIEMKIDDR